MYQQPSSGQQIKHSLPTITITDPRTGRTVTWRMSQPVQIWSVGATKWCPGEISYITQDADGYCLDVRYWAKPQLPKAKYLAPLSDCLRPISSDFTCRTDWTAGSKVECFSNSQKRWYKATVVDVIRYPDDKEDWLKIQWSLDINPNALQKIETPNSTNSNTPQIMSKEVGRSSIWIRHRYPSFKNSSPPNMDNSMDITPNNNNNMNMISSHKKSKKSKKKFKREKDNNPIQPMDSVHSMHSNDSNMDIILSPHHPNRGPPSKEISYSMPDGYNNVNNNRDISIRKFEATQSHNNSFINDNYSGPPLPNKSIPTKSQKMSLTPPNELNDNENENDIDNNGSPEFGAEFKPNDYVKKADMKQMDLEMEQMFDTSDDDEEEEEEQEEEEEEQREDDSEQGSVLIKSTDDEENESDSGSESDSEMSENNKQRVVIPQSETRAAQSVNNASDEETKELNEEIDELKFRLQITEQDLNEERETSGPLLKEVEMQKIRIAKLEETINKLQSQKNRRESPSPDEISNAEPQPTELNENREEIHSKLEEFKKSMAKDESKNKKQKRIHQRSQSFTTLSQSALHGLSGGLSGGDTQELIDAIYDRKVTLLNDQIIRLQSDNKKKENKLVEYKAKDKLRKREIQLLENELSEIRQSHSKSRSDTQNISMYRDQVRKLTQTNDSLKKALQTADDKLKSAELKKQDLSEEFKIQRQITNNLQQKVQRVLQQNNTISNQIELLSHYNSNSSVLINHLDTIRKCNMRAIQILHEIIEKNRRKRSDGYSLKNTMTYSRESINIFNNNNSNQLEEDTYERYHSTKSTRFSDKKGRDRKSINSITNNNNNSNQRFDFGDTNTNQIMETQTQSHSTRSRGYNTQYGYGSHHQQRSEQIMNDNHNEEHNNNNENGHNINNINVRMKRVSYDYVDGNQIQAKYNQKKKNVYMNHQMQQSFDENEEDKYKSQSQSKINDLEGQDINGYFNKLWIVKFPRRSSKVQLFGGNKGHKTQILLENKYLIFKCDQTNNNLITKLNVNEIKNYEITEKKNLSIFTKINKKYKIKCEQEKEAHFWYNILTQFIQQNT